MHSAKPTLQQQLHDSLRTITPNTKIHPTIGLIIGSGLGALTGSMQIDSEIDYADIAHMPQATAPGHEGKLVLGKLDLMPMVVLAGRFHFYEGYSMEQVTYPVRLARALGADTLILTSIVGSMNPKMPPGSLVLLDDHINLMEANPLIGPNDENIGPRFPDMSAPYDKGLQGLALQVARAEGISLNTGIYAAVTGPNLETRAEYRFLRQIGADVVGMSMVPEVLVARHSGMRVLAITVVSDACIPENLKPASVEELLKVAAKTEPALTTLLRGIISQVTASA